MGNIIAVIWQIENTSILQHSKFLKKVQEGLGMDALLCCLVF